MGMSFNVPEKVTTGGGNYLDTPGTYHCIVKTFDEAPMNKNKELIHGFKVGFQVLEGTERADGVCTEIGKTFDLIFFNPKPSDTDQGMFARVKQARFFMAVGQLNHKMTGKEIEIDTSDQAMVGQQAVLTLEKDKNEKYLQLHYSDLWHVDDPEVKKRKFPLDEARVKARPDSWHRPPEWFEEPKSEAKSGNGGKSKPKPESGGSSGTNPSEWDDDL